jgi:hypothetical protein
MYRCLLEKKGEITVAFAQISFHLVVNYFYMKKFLLLPSLLLLFSVACNRLKDQTRVANPCLTKEDSLKIRVYDKFFGVKASAFKTILDAEIPNDLANECIEEHKTKYHGSPDFTFIKNAYSSDVSFSSYELGNWLQKLTLTTDCDNLRIFFSVYTPNFAAHVRDPHVKVGRMSVILWPYHGDRRAKITSLSPNATAAIGDEAAAFNLGDIHP